MEDELAQTVPLIGNAESVERDALTCLVDNGQADIDKQLLRAQLRSAMFGISEAPLQVGRFSIVGQLGSGGMGEVYLAHDSHLDRQVAVKLVHTKYGGGSSASALSGASRRLLREAQSQARLSHPNVVQVYEAGVFHGRVFLAMELIRGTTLGAWVNARTEKDGAKAWRPILDVLLAAANGLSAAHRAGLVHRDFKPANVLVGDDGRVCVADFGLARGVYDEQNQTGVQTQTERSHRGATTAKGGSRSARKAPDETESLRVRPSVRGTRSSREPRLTATGTVLGTPAYMSPEQHAANPLESPVDARSDQFSFCVTAYEALYGARPFAGTNRPSLEFAIAEGRIEPPPRDTAVPTRVWRALRRGLAADPADRHPDLESLIAALAWKPRWGLVIGAGLLLCGAVVGGALTFHTGNATSSRCAAAGASAQALWNPAVAASARQEFLSIDVPYAQESWARVHSRLSRYVRDLGAERAAACEATYERGERSEELFTLQSLCLERRAYAVRAFVEELQRGDSALVEHGVAIAASLPSVHSCRDGDALMLGVRPPEDPEVAAIVDDIRAQLARAWLRNRSARMAHARDIAELQLARTDDLSYPPIRAEALWMLGLALRDLSGPGDGKRAESLLGEAADLAERHRHDRLAAEVWLALSRLASAHHARMDTGHGYARRALAVSARVSEDSALYARALALQGELYRRERAFDEAEDSLRGALALVDKNSVDQVQQVEIWHMLANTLYLRGRADSARDAYRQARVLSTEALGAQHPRALWLERDEATFLADIGQLDEAYQRLHRVADEWHTLYGPNDIRLGRAHLELANIDQQRGDLTRAERHARTGRDILLHNLPPEHIEHAESELVLALLAFRARAFERALAHNQRALALKVKALGEAHIDCVLIRLNISETLARLGRYKPALALLPDIESAIQGLAHPALKSLPHKVRGLSALGQRRPVAARAHFTQALTLLRSQTGYPLELADALWGLARAVVTDETDQARKQAHKLAREARDIYASQGRSGAAERDAITTWLGDPQP